MIKIRKFRNLSVVKFSSFELCSKSNSGVSTLCKINNRYSSLYTIPLNTTNVIAVSKRFDLTQFRDFLLAFNRHYALRITKSNEKQSFRRMLNLYICLYLIHDSRIITQLYSQQVYLTMPDFIIPIMSKICTQVISSNKDSGTTRGELHSYSSIDDINIIISGFSKDQWDSTLAGTIFETLDKDYIDQFRLELTSDIYYRVTKYLDDSLRDCCSLTYLGSKRPEIVSDQLGFYTQATLGIYRFRNSYDDGCYNLTQSSFSAVRESAIVQMANFLTLFEPKFSFNGRHDVTGLFAGDIVLSVEGVHIEEAWYSYLDYSSRMRPGKLSPTKDKTLSMNKPLSTQLIDNDNSADGFTTIERSIDEYTHYCYGYGEGGYIVIPITKRHSTEGDLYYSIRNTLDFRERNA